MPAPADLATLDRGKYLRLTTYRRDGTPVPTPVWFVVDGDVILVWTDAASGKVKRLRHTAAVEVALCDAHGRPNGNARPATATLLTDPGDHRRAHDLLNRKYGLTKRAIELGYGAARIVRRRPRGEDAIVELRA